jgi:hypothetical protein
VRAMPTTPWMFVYRDSIEVLMSHFVHHQQPGGDNAAPRNFQPDCLQGYSRTMDTETTANATQYAILSELVRRAGKTLSDLSREEYCAATIAAWCTAAVRQDERSPSNRNSHWHHPAVPVLQGVDQDAMSPSDTSATATTMAPPHWFVNYNELPFVLWETLLPALWTDVGGPSSDEIQKMLASTKVHSGSKQQASNTRGGHHWKEDATLKRGQAPQSIQEAAQLFMDPVYAQMESIRSSQSQPPSD